MPITIDVPDLPAPPTPASQRKPRRAPWLSTAPWWGFSAHDIPRSEPLPRCPSERCCRVRQCISAIDNLYCLRTHHTLPEQRWLMKRHPLSRETAKVPPVKNRKDALAVAHRTQRIMEIRLAFNTRMTTRWKAGEFDHLYGPYKAKGVLMVPPEKGWVEEN